MGKVYAVRSGRKTGIFNSWAECEKQVKGYSGARYKSFSSIEEANAYLNGDKELDSTQLLFNNEDLQIYVDGSYSKNRGVGGYGCVMVKGDKVIHTVSNSIEIDESENLWNVTGEIAGALAAIDWAISNNFKKVTLYYDYEGIKNWAEGSWSAKKKLTKNYVEKIKELSKLIEIQFVKVKAHSGDKYNEMADELAKQSIENPPTRLLETHNLIEDFEEILDTHKFTEVVGDISKEEFLIKYNGYVFNDYILKKIAKYYWRMDGNKIKDLARSKANLDIGKLELHINFIDKQDNVFKKIIKLEGEQRG